MTSDEAEFVWACGLFEGEGSILHLARSDYPRAKRRRLTLGTTDGDVAARFRDAIGIGRLNGPYPRRNSNGEPKKEMYMWAANCWDDIVTVLPRMLPWLGQRRRSAAEALLADPPGTRGRHGGKKLAAAQ